MMLKRKKQWALRYQKIKEQKCIYVFEKYNYVKTADYRDVQTQTLESDKKQNLINCDAQTQTLKTNKKQRLVIYETCFA
jgi:hypothetical protein